MHIVLTRSEEENISLWRTLSSFGFSCFHSSLVTYKNIFTDYRSILADCAALIITSKYLASIIPYAHEIRNDPLKVYVVGQTSSAILHLKGYNIVYIAKNAEELKKAVECSAIYKDTSLHKDASPCNRTSDNYNSSNNIFNNHKIDSRSIIYLSGVDISTNMPNFVKRHIVYDVQYKNNLNHIEYSFFKNYNDNYVLLYSENSALTFIKLLNKYNLLYTLKHSTAFTISKKVADIVSFYFSSVMVYSDNFDLINGLVRRQVFAF